MKHPERGRDLARETIAEKPPAHLLQEAKVFRTYCEHILFHGTSRFANGYSNQDKSAPTGEICDVLQGIAKDGIQPQRDTIAAVLLAAEHTVSLTQQRLYARCYATLFGTNASGETGLTYEFGSRKFWSKTYMKETKKGALTMKNIQWLPAMVQHLIGRIGIRKLPEVLDWRQQQRRWLMNRAKIEGNYPIILGIQKDTVSPMRLPQGIGFFEVRSADPLPPSSLSHIEVPAKHMESTREMLTETGLQKLPILPMEAGEALSWGAGYEEATKRL